MSNEQINQIMQKLEQQNKNFADYVINRENHDKEIADAYGKFALFVKNRLDNTNIKIDHLAEDVIPIVKLSKNVQGFDRVSVWILKALILIGAGIGVLYGAIKWLRQ